MRRVDSDSAGSARRPAVVVTPDRDSSVAVAVLFAVALVGACRGGASGSPPGAGGAGAGTGLGGSGMAGAPAGGSGGAIGGRGGATGGSGGAIGGRGGATAGSGGAIGGSNGGAVGVGGGGGGAGAQNCGGDSGRGSLGIGGGAAIDPRIPATDCTAALGTPSGPVLFDATVRCDSASYPISVAIAADNGGYLGLGDSSAGGSERLMAFQAPDQVSFEVGPYVRDGRVSVDPAGTPHFLGNGVDGQVLFYRGDSNMWSRQSVTLPSGQEGGGVSTPARFATDGRAFLAYHLFGPCSTFGALSLATRAVAGGWSVDELPPGTRWWEQLVVDSQQRPHIVSIAEETPAGDPSLSEWQPQSGAVQLASVKPYAEDYPLAVPITGGGGVAAAVRTEAGIGVVAPDTGGVTREWMLPATGKLTVTGCPPIAASGTMTFPPRPCTETGEGAVSLVGLAAPGDGAVRVAYVSTRVDRDVSQECHQDQFGSITCSWPTTANRIRDRAGRRARARRWQRVVGALAVGDRRQLPRKRYGRARLAPRRCVFVARVVGRSVERSHPVARHDRAVTAGGTSTGGSNDIPNSASACRGHTLEKNHGLNNV